MLIGLIVAMLYQWEGKDDSSGGGDDGSGGDGGGSEGVKLQQNISESTTAWSW